MCFKGLEDTNPEIGYGILDEFQRNGYATEAVKLAVKWAFEQPKIVAVEAETDPDNVASQKVLAKCGFHSLQRVKVSVKQTFISVNDKVCFLL